MQDGCAEEMSSTTQSHAVVFLKDGGHEHESLCFESSHHACWHGGCCGGTAVLQLSSPGKALLEMKETSEMHRACGQPVVSAKV